MITYNIYYSGQDDNAKRFVSEMIESGTVKKIKEEKGNLKYDYFYPVDRNDTVLLIDSWECQEALDNHHASEMMNTIIDLRNKYELKMHVERYINDDVPVGDLNFIKHD